MGNTTGGRNARNKGRYWAAFLILALLVLVFLVLSICIGTVNIPLSEIPRILGKNGGDDTGHAALLEGGIVTPPDDLALAFFPAGGHVHENIIMSVNDVFHSYSFLSILIVRSRRR